jgi:hypothetical protein
VARLAARQFESGGGFSPVMVMLGDADGPQAYLRQVEMGQALAESGAETLAANQANNAVATVFRTQAHKLLVAKTFVKLTKGKRNKLAGELAMAQSKASSLKAAGPSGSSQVPAWARGSGNGMMVNAPYTGAFIRIDSMYQPGGLIGAVRSAG